MHVSGRRSDDGSRSPRDAFLVGRTRNPAELIDLDRDPPLDAADPRRLGVVDEARAGMARIGAAELPGFVALPGDDTEPDTMSSDLLEMIRYGHTSPIGSTD